MDKNTFDDILSELWSNWSVLPDVVWIVGKDDEEVEGALRFLSSLKDEQD